MQALFEGRSFQSGIVIMCVHWRTTAGFEVYVYRSASALL